MDNQDEDKDENNLSEAIINNQLLIEKIMQLEKQINNCNKTMEDIKAITKNN